MKNTQANWTMCSACQGRGQKSKGIRKKVRLRYQRALSQFQQNNHQGAAPVPPKGHLDSCLNCHGYGIIHAANVPSADTDNYPHIAIIGAGIGGVALAVACLHRGIPFTLYERDNAFDERAQGYGLTLQQASRAIEALGIFSLEKGLISTRHVVHASDGKVLGEWGIRKWGASQSSLAPKRTNVHIARQSLRLALLEQLGAKAQVQWSHQLVDLTENADKGVDLSFQVDGQIQQVNADLVVGGDGIRSAVRRLTIGEAVSPLRYLGCIVILGICPLSNLKDLDSDLLDSATVFQSANGNERIYMMPYDSESVMWQLSFPMPEEQAKALSEQGVEALKKEALRRCQWHSPIPQIITATQEALISGYPAYDRDLLSTELLQKGGQVTLMGDAAHPMSPFKGQGANQALLDALSLARAITKNCRPLSKWKQAGVRESVLTEYESEMLARTASKVKDSAKAAQFLHSDTVLHEGNEPRGRCLKRGK